MENDQLRSMKMSETLPRSGRWVGTTEHEEGYGSLEDHPGDSTLIARRLKTNYQSTNTNPIYSTRLFYKKLGSDHSTKSFLISHEILSILVPKVS